MGKKPLINQLVDRKLTSGGKGKAFCVCMARRFCIGAVQPTGGDGEKK